jgi:hypothetical protein
MKSNAARVINVFDCGTPHNALHRVIGWNGARMLFGKERAQITEMDW